MSSYVAKFTERQTCVLGGIWNFCSCLQHFLQTLNKAGEHPSRRSITPSYLCLQAHGLAELLHDAPLSGSPLWARAHAFHLQNAQTGDKTTAAELTGALSLVWVVLCAQLTPEEQLLGNGERLWEQHRCEQVT